MNRTVWKFGYQADKLLDAAKNKLAWHNGRLEWWAAKQKDVQNKIRAEGLEIDESVAVISGGYSTSNISHRGPTVQIRNDLLTDHNECVGKVAEHRAKVRDYDSWVQVLNAEVELRGDKAVFELQQDDWLFFFGT